VKNLVVVPISFVSEHIETLEEIDMEYRELAEENGIENWRRCPALNSDMTFINDMADLVVDSLNSPITTVTEACIANNCDIEDKTLDEAIGISTRDEARMAERLNGRIAMLGVVGTLLLELASGKGVLHLFGM
jgi:ferrochelatase